MISSYITDFGVSPQVEHPQTTLIQNAIDRASEKGGGTVVFPSGTYTTGTLYLKSHVTLHLENGACLKGSSLLSDYPYLPGSFTDAVGQKRGKCLLVAIGTEGSSITGSGTIDGNGKSFGWDEDGRPFLVRFIGCKQVKISGVRLQNSAGWVSHFLACEEVFISDLTIRSHTNGNNDGIDIDSCRNVRISHCDISTGDDAICLKTTLNSPTENVVITGCLLQSDWGALKLGTESVGDMRNILISDCIIRDTLGGGLKIISMDGANIENVMVSNIIMDHVSGPIFIRLGSRLRTYQEGTLARQTGSLRKIKLSNIQIRTWEKGEPLWGFPRKAGILITGIPGSLIEDLQLENFDVTFPGGETGPITSEVPERIADYPEFPAFGTLPSWAIYLRHVTQVRLHRVRLKTEQPDCRSPLVMDDAHHVEFHDVCTNGLPINMH